MGTLSGVGLPPFERLGIVGFGLVGGSVALAAKRRWPALTITVCDPAPESHEAVTQGLVAAVVTEPKALAGCDLIVVATPVTEVPRVLGELSEAGVDGLVTDVASTKRAVMNAAGASSVVFVGGHPVVTSASPGLASARADLFDGRAWLLVSGVPERPVAPTVTTDVVQADGTTVTTEASPAVLEALLATFVVGLGAKPEWTDAVTHDKVMAHVSQAPAVIAEALKAVAESGGAAGPATERDIWPTSELAGQVDTNADFIASALQALAQKLPTSAEALMQTPMVRALLERAR